MRPIRLMALLAVISLFGIACSSNASRQGSLVTPTTRERRSTTTTTQATTTTTTIPVTTTTKAPLLGLGQGSSGPAVLALQQRLVALHYDLPEANGNFGAATQQAVYAFQKVNGMARSGRATDDVLARLATAEIPTTMVPAAGGTHIEVDVARQVLFYVQGGVVGKVVAVSTGSGNRFCNKGRCDVAVTPGGAFRVRGKIRGWQVGELGRLYSPSYFNGNIAVHGSLSIPPTPASHGCVRVPMTSADWLFAAMPNGMAVYVLNGPNVPPPFADEAPTTTSQAPSTTTTTPSGSSSTSTSSSSTTTSTTEPATTSTTGIPAPL